MHVHVMPEYRTIPACLPITISGRLGPQLIVSAAGAAAGVSALAAMPAVTQDSTATATALVIVDLTKALFM